MEEEIVSLLRIGRYVHEARHTTAPARENERSGREEDHLQD
jgi:hypothetical protein